MDSRHVESQAGLFTELSRWWQHSTGEEDSPFDGDTPAWLISLLVHVGVLLGLALVGLQEPQHAASVVTIIQPQEAVEDVLEIPQEMAVADESQPEVGAESDQNMEVAQALAPALAAESVVPLEADVDVPTDVQVEPLDVLPTAQTLNETMVVKGAVGAATTGATGAVDRLTGEIAASLEQRPTVVCWVFDRSVSLAGQRKEIAARLERVFEELGVNRAPAHRPDLKNIVIAFGEKVDLVHKATSDAETVVKAVESIPVDNSGVEMTFTAIQAAVNTAAVFRRESPRRNVMIVVFTDEVGNDQNKADDTARLCRNFGMSVYVVGVPAPFGTDKVKFKFVEFDPKYEQDVQWAVVEQGPETLYPEVVHVRSGGLADEAIDSGFGPFSLSKLCAATGGIYFAVHANRGASGRVTRDQTAPMSAQLQKFFDPDVMRAYQPDYLSASTIDKALAGNKAKKALVEAARSAEISPMESPTLTFPRKDDGALAGLLSDAQKEAARIQPRIDALAEVLRAGLSDRDKIKEKRWQAGYDLSLGRVLALKVRTDAYNTMLAQAKSGLKFKDPKNDTWVLEPSEDLSKVGSQTEKVAQQAMMLLERVRTDHPGTPWAFLAAEELGRPLGYQWAERHTGVNTPKMGGGGGGNPGAGVDDKKKMLAAPKPKRPLKNL